MKVKLKAGNLPGGSWRVRSSKRCSTRPSRN